MPHYQDVTVNLADKFEAVKNASPYITKNSQVEGTSSPKTIPTTKRKQTNFIPPEQMSLNSDSESSSEEDPLDDFSQSDTDTDEDDGPTIVSHSNSQLQPKVHKFDYIIVISE
jgi:hypothetical protein